MIRAFGREPTYRKLSTDANVPMSMGIPSVVIGRGPGGRQHSLDEWADVGEQSSLEAAQSIMLTILLAAEASAP